MSDMANPIPSGRQLNRAEAHDLGMIIKDRAKVLKAHAEEQSAALLADFEKKLAAEYTWDQDEIWKEAITRANAVVQEAMKTIAARCEELGIPKTFAPAIGLSWQGRGENAINARRQELRRVAKTSIDAMEKATITKIEQQSLDLRTQIVAMGLLSDDARVFLESLAPVTEAMRSLNFAEMEKKLEREQEERAAYRRRIERD